MIILNGVVQTCHMCGSNELKIIDIDQDCNVFNVWCNQCEGYTLEDVINLNQIKCVELHIDKEL